jgi:hypothetical protein
MSAEKQDDTSHYIIHVIPAAHESLQNITLLVIHVKLSGMLNTNTATCL